MSTVLPTMTVTSPFWQTTPNGAATYSMLYGRNSIEQMASMHLGKPGYRTVRRAMRALLGAGTGSSKAESVTQIAPGTPFNDATHGGVRTVASVTLQSGNTTAADLTYVQGIVDRAFNMAPAIASYPVDISGNGGGGKVGR